MEQVLTAMTELDGCDKAIEAEEGKMNALIFSLYALSDEERALVLTS